MATAPVQVSSAGDNTIVAAVAGKKVRVRAWSLSALTANNVKWKSGASVDKTGLYYIAATATVNGVSAIETAAGDALVLNLSAATAVGGVVDYSLE